MVPVALLFLLPLVLCDSLIASVTVNETDLPPPPHHLKRRGTTVLYDDFSGDHVDKSKWSYEVTASGGGNGEFQMYTPEGTNSFVKNGILHIKPTFTTDRFGSNFLNNGHLDLKGHWGSCTASFNNGCSRSGNKIPPIMSGKLMSKATISHGRVEVVAKIPKGDWLWPAIWLLPHHSTAKYGGWPTSGEIDIMESRGNLNLRDSGHHSHGVSQVLSTIHLGPTPQQHKQHGSSKLAPSGKTWADNYHTYSVDWTASHIRMEIDGQPVLDWKTPAEGYFKHEHYSGHNVWAKGGHDAPFDGKFGLILNVAVGATDGYFNDGWNNGAKPWRDHSPNAMHDFWNNRSKWQHTWHGDDVAMKIKSVKMIQY